MSKKKWIQKKLPEFVRDILREFCLTSVALEKGFAYYEQNNQIQFEFLHDLLGSEMNKGPLWRLKDMAHVLAEYEIKSPFLVKLIDWTMGYVFHECVKLKEDAYQQTQYRPWFQSLKQVRISQPEVKNIVDELFQVINQTSESISREVKRIKFLQYQLRQLFILYLPYHRENELLARFIFAQNQLIQTVFKHSYDKLLKNIYQDDLAMLYLLAAQSLRKGGWFQQAEQAITLGLQINPQHKECLQEAKIIASRLKKVGN